MRSSKQRKKQSRNTDSTSNSGSGDAMCSPKSDEDLPREAHRHQQPSQRSDLKKKRIIIIIILVRDYYSAAVV